MSDRVRTLQEVKETIRERADFVGIVGRYTKLIKSGHRFKGCCPFHKEKTPSFYVNPQEGFFKCFGCDAGGDVFSFLMRIEGYGFMEAMEELAQELHIEIPKGMKVDDARAKEARSERESGFDLLDRAAKYYHRVLASGATPGARQALEYLASRGITPEETEELLIGWAPESGNELLRKITNPMERDLALRAGIFREGQRGLYEFFRSRLMIPIRDVKGRTCAFSGRTMTPVTSDNPKYKNSSETDWFKKKEVLYGLERAQKLIRAEDYVCLVEGYFDQWAFHRHGIPAVAVMGTALSEDHLRTLGRFTKRAVLVLDTDRAGVESTLRAIPSFVKSEWNVKVFSDLGGKDPDEWLGQGSAVSTEEVKSKLLHASEAVEWWATLVLKQSQSDGIDRLEAFRRLATPWRWAVTKAHKTVIADEVGRILGLPSDEVRESLQELAANAAVRDRVPQSAPVAPVQELTKSFSTSSIEGPAPGTGTSYEEAFLWWIRHWEQLSPTDASGWDRRVELFAPSPVGRAVAEFAALKKAPVTSENLGPEAWLERLGEAEKVARSWIHKGLVLRDDSETPEAADKVLNSYRELEFMLRRETTHKEISRIQSRIRGLAPSDPELSELLQKVQKLRLNLERQQEI